MTISALNDVTPDTSSEEIAAVAQQVIEDVKAERTGASKPEGKSDAQLAAEHAGKPLALDKPSETTAENNSGSNTADKGEESGNAPEVPEWLTDDVKAEATAFGIDESELADFASREEFDRALRLFDRRALEAGRKSLETSDDGGQARNDKGQFVKKEEPKPEQAKPEAAKDGRYQVSLNPEIYDEEIIGEFTRMRDHYESRLEALESHFAQAAIASEVQLFDSEIDKLDMPKLFGVTGKETADEIKNREDVLAQAKVLQAGYRSFGRDVPIEALVARAAPMVFTAEFEKQLLKQRTLRISRQSNGRMGGSPVKPQPPSEDPRARADRLYREMESR